MAIAFNPGSTVPSLGLRRASGSSLSAHGRQRSVLTLGSKRAATVGLRASVESATETAKQKKAGRGLLKARPIGIGHAAPAVSISNKDMEKIVETTDDWIKTRTGIENRHVLKGSETLRDLAIQAGKVAYLNYLHCLPSCVCMGTDGHS